MHRATAAVPRPPRRGAGRGDRRGHGVLAIAAGAVAIGALILWLIGGVGLGDLARYLGYEAAFVVGPGWLVLRAISPGVRGRAWQLALGWPIGLTLEILAFSLTAALGIRDAFFAYPLIVAIPAVFAIRRRRRPAEPRPDAALTRWSRWAIVGLCLLAFAYIGIAYFTITPLPGSAPGVIYNGDITFYISVAASALHHWPPDDYRVAGEPFTYHYFSAVHMAAISQVTGINLPLVVFRLYLLPLIALLVLEVSLLGRAVTGRAWAGPLTAALFLLVREIDLIVHEVWPFGGFGMIDLWVSPSQLLGMALFVPALLVLGCLLDPRLAARASPWLPAEPRQLWPLLALFLIGATGAKSVILPMFVGGLVLYLLWLRLRDRRFDRNGLVALALCGIVFAGSYLLLYRGGSMGLHLNPPATIKQMAPLLRLHAAWPGGVLADAGFWVLAVLVGTVMFFGAPLLGVAWILRRPRPNLEGAAVLSLSLLAAGAGAFFFLYDEFIEQTYFTQFGLIAVLPFAAMGLMRFADGLRSSGVGWRSVAAFVLIWLVGVWLLAIRADRLYVHGHPLRGDLLAYVPVALAIGALALGALRFTGRLRALLAGYAVLAVLLTAALDNPLDTIPFAVRQWKAGGHQYTTSPGGLRPREYEGMEWIRDHVPEDAILAVSNDRTRQTRYWGPGDNDYPAFTEHPTFREGWVYTSRANQIGQRKIGKIDPFPERRALEQAVYKAADPEALRVMEQRYGVSYLVISKKDGAVNPRVYRFGRLIYSNGALDVIEL
jgi:hypothetical protein